MPRSGIRRNRQGLPTAIQGRSLSWAPRLRCGPRAQLEPAAARILPGTNKDSDSSVRADYPPQGRDGSHAESDWWTTTACKRRTETSPVCYAAASAEGSTRAARRQPRCPTISTRTQGGLSATRLGCPGARGLLRRIESSDAPKQGSWLNIAENEFGAPTRQCLSGRGIGHLETLRAEGAARPTDGKILQRRVAWLMATAGARRRLESGY